MSDKSPVRGVDVNFWLQKKKAENCIVPPFGCVPVIIIIIISYNKMMIKYNISIIIYNNMMIKYNMIVIIIYNNMVFKYNKIIIIKYNISPVTPPGLLELTDCPLFSASLT